MPDKAQLFLNSMDDDKILIIGAGAIQPRKGVDLFISVAAKIKKGIKNQSVIFAWIGAGYDPINDFNVSLWINDQVIKCELSNDLVILDNSPAYERLMERADYFLMTSRLDPLPNVSIDAMFTSTPMLCFQKACGMASLMSEDPILRQNLIAEYLDTNSMAEKVIRLLQDTNAYRDTARRCQLKAIEWFNMHNYIEKIKEYGEEAIQANKRLSKDFDYLIGTNEYDKREFLRYQNQRNSLKEVLKYYLISWKNQIWARKPLPGYHLGSIKTKC